MKIIARVILNIFFGLFFRVKVYGRENVPEKGGLLLCANHLGNLDVPLIGYKNKRVIHYMTKIEMFKNPIVSFIIKKLGAFPIKRGVVDVEAIKTAINLLEAGNIVGIFPEGTRLLKNKGKKIKVKPGAAMLAIKSGVPILPVAVQCNYRLFSKVIIRFGKPFTLDLEKDKKYTTEEMSEISQGIMDKIYSLMEEN